MITLIGHEKIQKETIRLFFLVQLQGNWIFSWAKNNWNLKAVKDIALLRMLQKLSFFIRKMCGRYWNICFKSEMFSDTSGCLLCEMSAMRIIVNRELNCLNVKLLVHVWWCETKKIFILVRQLSNLEYLNGTNCKQNTILKIIYLKECINQWLEYMRHLLLG